MDDRTNTPDLEHLFSAACDESLTDEERKSLDSALSADTQTQDAYLAFCRLHADIRMHVQSRRSIESALLAVIQGEVKPLAVSFQLSASSSTHHSPLATHYSKKSWLDRASRRPVPPALAVAAMVMISVVAWMGVTTVKNQLAESGKSTDEHQEPTKPEFVAWLMKAHETQWLDGTEPQKTKLMPGQRLAISKGLIEIQYRTRAVVVIEGPAEFYVGTKAQATEPAELAREEGEGGRRKQANSGFLKLGKLVARVEGKKAKGFTIDTPAGSIEDLGTEFGVAVTEMGVQMHVLSGSVSATFVSADTNASETRILRKDESLRISPEGHVESKLPAGVADSFVSISKRLFVQSTKRTDPSDFLKNNPDLLVHYPFARGDHPAKLVNLGRGGNTMDAVIAGAKWSKGHSPTTQSLSIARAEDHIRMNVPGEFSQLTIAMWVRAESLDRALHGLVMSDGWNRAGQVHWQILRDGRLELAVYHATPYVHIADFRFEPQRWYHLAVACDVDAQQVSLFVDGRLVDRQTTPRMSPLVLGAAEIGNWASSGSVASSGRHLGGRIGELMIFTRTLNEREVRQCFLASTQKRVPIRKNSSESSPMSRPKKGDTQ